MTATIHDFPRSNPKADRAFWKGEEKLDLSVLPVVRVERQDTAPCEMNPGYVAPDGDCA